MAKITYPQLGNYSIAISYLLSKILDDEVVVPPPITTKTAEIGSKYSPDFICTPFKYTLGTLIEGLELGADTLIQMGGGCRYGYYHELQNQILSDLGYSFKLINLVNGGKFISIKSLLNDYGLNIKKSKILKYFFITKKMIYYIDKIEDYIRKNRCYELEKDSFNNLEKEMLDRFFKCKGYFHLRKMYKYYFKRFKKLPRKKVERIIKVGLIGELYTLMEPYANYNIEQLLNDRGISVTRFTNVTYLMFKKKKAVRRYLKKIFIKYRMGADALDNIYHTKWLCEKKFDGIIHIKSSFCTPEIGAMPIIESICQEYDIPLIFFTMDMNTSETGIKTRIEAFCDMLEMRNL